MPDDDNLDREPKPPEEIPAGYGNDAADKAFIESLVPPGQMAVGCFAIVVWVDVETGQQRWLPYMPVDLNVPTLLGILSMVQTRLALNGWERGISYGGDA